MRPRAVPSGVWGGGEECGGEGMDFVMDTWYSHYTEV